MNFTAFEQNLEGVITIDEISRANIVLKNKTNFTGQIKSDGKTYVELDETSTWILTGDSEISALTCGENAIKLNGYTLI